MRRVVVVGGPGSGKSTLAAAIGARTGLPVIHLDRHHWRPGWVKPDKPEWLRRVEAFTGAETWVIDGNYGSALDLTFARADTVVWLDLPSWLCLWRIVRRGVQHWGKVRPDMAEGCPEQLDWKFLAYTATFRGAPRQRIVDRLPGFAGTIVRIRRPRDVERFLRSL